MKKGEPDRSLGFKVAKEASGSFGLKVVKEAKDGSGTRPGILSVRDIIGC